MTDTVRLSDVAMAAYCPRKLYYARTGDRSPPPEYDRALELSRSYPALLGASDAALSTMGLAVEPAEYRRRLARARDRLDSWTDLVDPAAVDVSVTGKDVHGRIPKVLDDPPTPVLVSPGEPPENGVWEPQSVRAVGAAKALAWRERTPVEWAVVEYPLSGVVRRVDLTTRKRAAFRRAVRAARAIDAPPPRLHDGAKCEACGVAERCGVRTRSLRSLLSVSGGE
ncbi:MAG: hypothetical protein ABEJ55_05185 [Halanaeroarchaeum sp.]